MIYTQREFEKLTELPMKRRLLLRWEERLPEIESTEVVPLTYYPIDLVLALVAERFIEAGPKRAAIGMALPGLQLTLSSGIDRPDTYATIAVGQPGQLAVACGSRDELEAYGVFDPLVFVGTW